MQGTHEVRGIACGIDDNGGTEDGGFRGFDIETPE
jgi:hypothetical protein